MPANPYEKIAKPFGSRILELIQSLQVVRDSIAAVRSGKSYQLIPLYGQMRALLTDKSRQNSPLLLEIAAELDEELVFFAMPAPSQLDHAPELRESLILDLAGFPIALHRSLEMQEAVTMREFLDRPVLLYRGRNYSSRSIIELLANQAGGSHFAPDVTRDYAELMSVNFLGLAPLSTALLQLGELTFALGRRLLRRLCKFDLYLLLFIPEQKISGPTVLMDSSAAESPMRIFLLLHTGMKLRITLVGLDGSRADLLNEPSVDWPGPHYFHVSTDLSERLETLVRITTDGHETAALDLARPLFVSSQQSDFDTYWNRAREEGQGGLTFALGRYMVFGGEQSDIDRANLLLYFEKQRASATTFIYYKPGTYGHTSPKQKGITLSNGAEMRSRESLVAEHSAAKA